MKLIYPQKKSNWNPKQLGEIPTKSGDGSGFLMIAAAQSGFDIYVAMTNHAHSQVWIEKTTTLNPLARSMCFEMLERIPDEKEFIRAHQYFIKEGFLDGNPKEKA